MCQAVLSPNLTKKFQREVSQIASDRFPCVMLLGGLSVNLNHLKIEKNISLCISNYVRVTNLCREHQQKLPKTSLVISLMFNKRLDFDTQDTLAHSLFPRDGNIDRSHSFEIMNRAVGDCLLDAMSRLVYGNQNHASELRTRMTLEALLYAEWYLVDENLGINLPRLDTGYTLAERYSLFQEQRPKITKQHTNRKLSDVSSPVSIVPFGRYISYCQY